MTEIGIRDWAQRSGFLDKLDEEITLIVRGRKNRADARCKLTEFLGEIGYITPLEDRGTLYDFWSEGCLNLLLDINVALIHGHRNWCDGQDAAVLDEFPAQELIAVRKLTNLDKWVVCWLESGGSLTQGRMVALKSAPVWAKISIFKLPYPPFDLEQEVGVQDLDRDDAEALGLLKPNDRLEGATLPFTKDLLRPLFVGHQGIHI